MIELLVVIAIMGILISILLAAIQGVREMARRTTCSNNLKNVGTALANYDSTRKTFPPGRLGCDGASGYCWSGRKTSGDFRNSLERCGASAFALILPYMEQQQLYDTFNWKDLPIHSNVDWTSDPNNLKGVKTRVPVFICPSHPSVDTTMALGVECALGSYALCSGTKGVCTSFNNAKYSNDGVFYYVKRFSTFQIKDGLSNTLFAGEVRDPGDLGCLNVWNRAERGVHSLRTCDQPMNQLASDPPNQTYGAVKDPDTGQPVPYNGAFGSAHRGGATFLFGDACVRFLSEEIDLPTYRAMATRSGGDAYNMPSS